jgi:hypothetical protein
MTKKKQAKKIVKINITKIEKAVSKETAFI